MPKVSQWSQRPPASGILESSVALDLLHFHTPSLCPSHCTRPGLTQGKHAAETHCKDVTECELSKAGQLRISEAAVMDRVSILLLGTERLPACSWATDEAADRAPDTADAALKQDLRGRGTALPHDSEESL